MSFYIEYLTKRRNIYGFIAIGKINSTKTELEDSFEKYKEYLIKNDLEVEFSKLFFLKSENALEELDKLPNYKRPYLRELLKELMK